MLQDVGEVAGVMEEGQMRGYRHFNIKVAPDPEFDVALAREVRRSAPEAFYGPTPTVDMILIPHCQPRPVWRTSAWMCWRPLFVRIVSAVIKL